MHRVSLAALLLLACDPTVAPTLGAVLSRVDVPRLLECAKETGEVRAKCLGAEAASTALDVACDHAAKLAEQATAAGTEDPKLARELDDALTEVGREIEATRRE